MHLLSGLFLLLCLGVLAYKAYKKIRKLRILSKNLSVAQFAKELEWNTENENIIYCIGIDRPDADNFNAVLILLQLLNGKSPRLLDKTNPRQLNKPTEITPVYILLTGRPFNPMNPPCVNLPGNMIKTLDENGNVIILSAKEFFSNTKNIVEKPNFVSHKKFAKILHGIFAGQLQLFLNSNGFIQGIHYYLFNGGIPPSAGINSAIHVFEPHMMTPDGEGGYILSSEAEIIKKNLDFFGMSTEDREALIKEEYRKLGIRTVMNDLEQFFDLCRRNSGCHIVCYGAGPLTPFYAFPEDIANRVVLFQLMGGVFNGMANILGFCFNNAVHFPEANQVNLFKNARTIYLTTEVCKWSTLLPTKELLDAIQAYAGYSKLSFRFREWVEQWNKIKGSPQTMFDVISVLPLDVLFNIFGTMSRVEIDTDGPNPKIPWHPVFGNMAFKLNCIMNQAVHGKFPPGNYAFDHNTDFEADASPFIKAIGAALM